MKSPSESELVRISHQSESEPDLGPGPVAAAAR